MSSESEFWPRCPTCDLHFDPGKSLKSMPFCSERCQLIDLGRWLNEEHTLPCETPQEDEQEEPGESQRGPQLPPGWHDP